MWTLKKENQKNMIKGLMISHSETKFYLDSFHQLHRRSGSCFRSPLTSDDNYDPHSIKRGFIQISHVIIPKITPLNITY